jgi:DNA-binding response OmpR family regulator
MSKIIIADDEQLIRKLVNDFLTTSGYTVLEAADGEQALQLFEANPDTDLLILDIMMPEYDGWEVARKVRKTSDVPIMMLTARSQDFDQITGFEAGADDYVTKPFSPAVLVKRVEAILKRKSGSASVRTDDRWGLTIDTDAHEVRIDGKIVELTLKEFKILEKLIKSKDRVYSREQLLDDVWGYDYFGDVRTVDSHVARLRTKLGKWGEQHLKTVYGVGYKIQESAND